MELIQGGMKDIHLCPAIILAKVPVCRFAIFFPSTQLLSETHYANQQVTQVAVARPAPAAAFNTLAVSRLTPPTALCTNAWQCP